MYTCTCGDGVKRKGDKIGMENQQNKPYIVAQSDTVYNSEGEIFKKVESFCN